MRNRTNSSGVITRKKIGKHIVPSNKINMALHNFRTKKIRKETKRKPRCKNKQNYG